MKQKFTSLFAIGILALTLNTSNVFATNYTNVQSTGIANQKLEKSKKINVSGNVQVTIVQDPESKKLYHNDSDAKANVYEKDDVIYVSAKKNGQHTAVTVYVNNISRITVEGNATVKTKNTLKVQYLQLILSDQSSASISTETESLYTKLFNESALTLSGSTGEHSISANELAVLNTTNLKVQKEEIEKRNIGYTRSK